MIKALHPALFAAVAALACAAVAMQVPGAVEQGGGLPGKYIDSSVPYVGGGGSGGAAGQGGGGVRIGIIDTGVDAFHPDFADGRGGSRIVGSYNLLGPGPAVDTDGHGTGVAGVAAANGSLRGMAPLAEIVSYKVSGDGLSVSPDFIIAAVERAIADGVDVVNISLGVNRTNDRIDAAVNRAVSGGVVVVAAAGNDGPAGGSIGSPGRNPNAITVGATYNNVTAGIIATLEAGGDTYEAVPMVGAPVPDAPVGAGMAFAGYARAGDIERAGGVDGMIVVAERGSDTDGELVYFSDKEKNAADAGAVALVVHNNEPGIFFGELVHDRTADGYEPRIPTVSMTMGDGIRLRDAIESGGAIEASLRVHKSPDFVAEFSSRGPVSPFYPKPDITAPGVFVNTTLSGGRYNLTSGTSFAAPHVSGAAALALEKWPHLSPLDVKSVLVTTADPVVGLHAAARGGGGEQAAAQAGRLNVTRALSAATVFSPPLVGIDLSPARPAGEADITARGLGGPVPPLAVSVSLPDDIAASYEAAASNGSAVLTVKAALSAAEAGGAVEPRVVHGSLLVADGRASYAVPVIVRVAGGAVVADEVGRPRGWLDAGNAKAPQGGAVRVGIEAPEGWTYAKVTITDAQTGSQYVTSSRPGEPGTASVGANGTHWIEAAVMSGGGWNAKAYGTVEVEAAAAAGPGPWDHALPAIPERQAAIVAAAVAAIAAAGIAASAKAGRGGPRPRRPQAGAP